VEKSNNTVSTTLSVAGTVSGHHPWLMPAVSVVEITARRWHQRQWTPFRLAPPLLVGPLAMSWRPDARSPTDPGVVWCSASSMLRSMLQNPVRIYGMLASSGSGGHLPQILLVLKEEAGGEVRAGRGR